MLMQILSLVIMEFMVLRVCVVPSVQAVSVARAKRLLLHLGYMLTSVLSIVFMEFVALQISLFLVVRVFFAVDSSPSPTADPYIPRAKRPPLVLEPFLRWLNDGIDGMAEHLAPLILVTRRQPRSSRPPASARVDTVLSYCWRLLVSLWRLLVRLVHWRLLTCVSLASPCATCPPGSLVAPLSMANPSSLSPMASASAGLHTRTVRPHN
jgi:hypothetical protein